MSNLSNQFLLKNLQIETNLLLLLLSAFERKELRIEETRKDEMTLH